jgi:hypothetical protein
MWPKPGIVRGLSAGFAHWIYQELCPGVLRAAPSFWLLPLMALWANLPGGFVFGLVLIGIVLLLGLVHMALAQGRAAEVLALLAPLILAAPLARQLGGADAANSNAAQPARGVLFTGFAIALVAGTVVYASVHRFAPHMRGSPVNAVTELKKLNLARVFNDYDFGGYLISSGVAPFTQSAATKLVDHVDGWQKIHSDGIATIHLRKAGALHTTEPAVDPKAK